jgi:hypothetical protein
MQKAKKCLARTAERRREGICGKRRFRLNNGQTCAVCTRRGFGGDAVMFLKSPLDHDDNPREQYPNNTGTKPSQHAGHPGNPSSPPLGWPVHAGASQLNHLACGGRPGLHELGQPRQRLPAENCTTRPENSTSALTSGPERWYSWRVLIGISARAGEMTAYIINDQSDANSNCSESHGRLVAQRRRQAPGSE